MINIGIYHDFVWIHVLGNCYRKCNKNYGIFDPYRLYCKKGCDA